MIQERLSQDAVFLQKDALQGALARGKITKGYWCYALKHIRNCKYLTWTMQAWSTHKPFHLLSTKTLLSKSTSTTKLLMSKHDILFHVRFIQSDIQNSAYHITNNRTGKIRYNSYRIGCKAMNICPVHKVDGPTQSAFPRWLQFSWGTTQPRQIQSQRSLIKV